ncbi:hypothetical protein ACFQYP_06545 [Nonomuraea antimicrobica]
MSRPTKLAGPSPVQSVNEYQIDIAPGAAMTTTFTTSSGAMKANPTAARRSLVRRSAWPGRAAGAADRWTCMMAMDHAPVGAGTGGRWPAFSSSWNTLSRPAQ